MRRVTLALLIVSGLGATASPGFGQTHQSRLLNGRIAHRGRDDVAHALRRIVVEVAQASRNHRLAAPAAGAEPGA